MKIYLRKKMRDMQTERYSGNALSRIVIVDLKLFSRLDRDAFRQRAG